MGKVFDKGDGSTKKVGGFKQMNQNRSDLDTSWSHSEIENNSYSERTRYSIQVVLLLEQR